MALSNVSGFPRIGRNRELKFATEGYWRGESIGRRARRDAPRRSGSRTGSSCRRPGIDLIPSNDFSYYDQVLDTIALVGAVPERYGWGGGEVDLDTYFAMARGRQSDGRRRHRDGDDEVVRHQLPLHRPRARPRDEILAVELEALRRARRGDGGGGDRHRAGADRPGQLPAPLQARRRGGGGLQPARSDRGPGRGLRRGDREARGAGRHLGPARRALLRRRTAASRSSTRCGSPTRSSARSTSGRGYCVKTYFDHVGDAYGVLRDLPIEGVGLDFTGVVHGDELDPAVHEHGGRHNAQFIADQGGLDDQWLFAGIVDGRNVWINHLEHSLDALEGLRRPDRPAGGLDQLLAAARADRPRRRARGRRRRPRRRGPLLDGLRRAEGGRGGDPRQGPRRRPRGDRRAARRQRPRTRLAQRVPPHAQPRGAGPRRRPDRGGRPPRDAVRGAQAAPAAEARTAQPSRRPRSARSRRPTRSAPPAASSAKARSSWRTTRSGCAPRSTGSIGFQEEIGLDVLVHGEPERNDMVQYFGEQMLGFIFTENAWVQSYGSRYVRPPIIFGDVSRPVPDDGRVDHLRPVEDR